MEDSRSGLGSGSSHPGVRWDGWPQRTPGFGASSAVVPDLGRHKILVVDDEPDILRSTQMLLEALGYESVLLKEADHVVEVAAREHPVLILQDVQMPQLDLMSLVRRLRSHSKTAHIPVALFSASPYLAETTTRTHVNGFLAKPFREEDLSFLLDRALDRKIRNGGTPL